MVIYYFGFYRYLLLDSFFIVNTEKISNSVDRKEGKKEAKEAFEIVHVLHVLT